ncbi:MAG: cation transporter [Candidatus Methanogranum gryphiswaldense]|nr:MAG: cation transporter [Candidatus Methanogranum sp. U3.2.1]
MKAVLEIKGICCPNCASKLEDRLRTIKGCDSVTYAFMTQRITLETSEGNMDSIITAAMSTVHKYEPKAEVSLKKVYR